MPAALGTALVFAAVTAAGDAPATRLFVDDGEQIVEYDLSSGRAVRTIPLPSGRLTSTAIAVNRVGQIAVPLEPDEERARLWLWTGRESRVVSRPLPKALRSDRLHRVGVDARKAVQARLSADGRHLYWLTNDTRVSRMVAREGGYEVPEIVRTARMHRTDTEGHAAVEIAAIPYPPCLCETGGCEETCPEPLWWAPEKGIDSSFFVTSWVPGQIGSVWLNTRRFVNHAGRWEEETLSRVVKTFADIASGDAYVEVDPDGGCCAWVNFDSDGTTLVRGGSRVTLFDEWARVGNRNYDVSFFSWNVRLSPDLSRVAQTVDVVIGGYEGAEIRLGAVPGAKPDPKEMELVKAAMRDLPAVEVLTTDGVVERRVPRRRLVGWRDPHRLVVLDALAVVILDVRDGRELATGIRVKPTERDRVERLWLR